MIHAHDLTKRYRSVVAVDHLSFEIHPGRVTCFLGPNGAGKSTTLRMILGLDTPSSGSATVNGQPYRSLQRPLRVVGSLLDATDGHGGRTGRNHLRWLAESNGLPMARVIEVLGLTGLTSAAGRRIRGYSLGMRQRLGLAAALLGDPPVLVLDEPAHGLDPHGIRWLRGFLRGLAAESRAVLVSSHLLPEGEQTADDVLLLAGGWLVRSATLAELRGAGAALVRSPEAARLSELLVAAGYRSTPALDDELLVRAPAEEVGRIAAEHGIVLHGLAEATHGLEDVFMGLTEGAHR